MWQPVAQGRPVLQPIAARHLSFPWQNFWQRRRSQPSEPIPSEVWRSRWRLGRDWSRTMCQKSAQAPYPSPGESRGSQPIATHQRGRFLPKPWRLSAKVVDCHLGLPHRRQTDLRQSDRVSTSVPPDFAPTHLSRRSPACHSFPAGGTELPGASVFRFLPPDWKVARFFVPLFSRSSAPLGAHYPVKPRKRILRSALRCAPHHREAEFLTPSTLI